MIDSKQQVATPGKGQASPELDGGVIAPKARSQFYEFWVRFRRHQMAVVGVYLFIFLLLVAIVGPFIVPDPQVDPATMFDLKNNPPTLAHPFGTNVNGLDVMGLVVHGARISLLLSTLAMLVACIVGTLVGLVAGYFGKLTDGILMRIADIFLSVPLLFVLLTASRFLVTPPPPGGSGGKTPEDASLRSLIILPVIIGLLTWPQVARLVRSVTLSVKEQEFVTGARAVGSKNGRIMFAHILPNVINPVVVAGTLLVGQNIVLESFLSFLGYGIQPPLRSWGTSLAEAQIEFVNGNWWWAFFPGFFILLTVLAINFIGDGLRDALDPRSKR
ncbi:MAG TPA: ABC transporter permease [Chloroflexia bacterium]|nr:ABC transporter permease [Chloroflexia bacterium]